MTLDDVTTLKKYLSSGDIYHTMLSISVE